MSQISLTQDNCPDTTTNIGDFLASMHHKDFRPQSLFPESEEPKSFLPNKSKKKPVISLEDPPISKDSQDKLLKSAKSKKKISFPNASSNTHRVSSNIDGTRTHEARNPFSSLLRPGLLSRNPAENPNEHEKKPKSFYGVISNFYLIRKFIMLLKNLTSKRTPKYLSKYHFELINDRAFVYEEYVRSNIEKSPEMSKKKTISTFQKICLFFVKIYLNSSKYFGIFDVNQSFTMFWNAIVGLTILYFFLYIPFFICFDDIEINELQTLIILKYFSLTILLLDIPKRLNTSSYKKGSLIVDRREIALNYFRKKLLADVFSLGPLLFQEILPLFSFKNDFHVILKFSAFMFYCKLNDFRYIVKKFEEMIFIDEVFHNTLALLKLIFRILVLSHIFACVWYFIGNVSLYKNNWISYYGLVEKPVWIRYLYSYYYVCVTMNTVGYGDISPQNPLEMLFCTGFIYVACGIFAYSLNSIGMIISDLTKRSKDLSRELNVINEFMNEKNISFDLRMRVRNYLEYIFKEEKIEKVAEQGQIISKLSDTIKEELLIEANGAVIRDIKLFSLNFSEDTLRKTVQIMKEVRYTPGDIIFCKNDYMNKDLFLVRKGIVELYIENESAQSNNDITIIKRLKEKELFGEKSFFTNRERSLSARSADFTTVYVIKQEEFLSILKKNSKDFEKFCEIKDSINIYNDFSGLYMKCTSCNQNTHLIDQCPILHYIPAHEIIIHRFNYNPYQKRDKYERNSERKKHKSLLLQNEIEKKAFIFQSQIMTKYDTDEEEDEDSEESLTGYNRFNASTAKSEPFSEEINFESSNLKEIEEENEEEKQNTEENISEKDENSMKFSENDKKKIQRRSTKKNALVLLKKNSRRSYKSSEASVHIESLDHLESMTTSSFSQKKGSQNSLLNKIYDHLVSLTKDKQNDNNKTPSQQESNKNLQIGSAIERSFEVDLIKNYDDYYRDGNVEFILEKTEEIRKRNIQKKMRKSKPYLNLLNAFDSRREKNRTENTEVTTSPKRGRINIMRRNFFKNAKNLEKLIMEEHFDPEKFKAYYIKKYEKKHQKNCFIRIFNCLKSMFKSLKKKVRRKNKKASSKTNSSSKIAIN